MRSIPGTITEYPATEPVHPEALAHKLASQALGILEDASVLPSGPQRAARLHLARAVSVLDERLVTLGVKAL